jgi:hypothetical protein
VQAATGVTLQWEIKRLGQPLSRAEIVGEVAS